MDRWTEKLSEYLDETLTQGEREALDAHLATCRECSETLDELRRVVDRARGLDDRPPSKDLWSGIATRIGSGTAVVSVDRARTASPARSARRLSFSIPQALAAGILLMAVSSGAVWMSLRDHQTPVLQPSPDSIDIPAVWQKVDASVDPVVDSLRKAVKENGPNLDTSTVRIVEKNLAIIDSAIAEARRALNADPNNNYLNHHLADVVRRRADLLRRVSTLGVRT
ncbi:MAG TPA: zf-HC2 domain-containing protein [Gemmatimonadales bacterium]|nr:zf-HC2 domain-containing protein [Gemmatimonadales bacterium]